jgi:hypothetical protein
VLAASGAWANGVLAGSATVTAQDGKTPISGGGSSTPWTFQLPSGAACSKDTFTGQYHVNGYLVPSTTDPATLSFNSSGPVDPKGGLAYPLVDNTGSPYVAAATAPNTGLVNQTPTLNYAIFSIDNAHPPGNTNAVLPAGTYNIGIACSTNATTNNGDKFWNAQVTFTASASDPNGETWTVVPGTPVPESSLALALPLSGLAVLGTGAVVVYRRRRRTLEATTVG